MQIFDFLDGRLRPCQSKKLPGLREANRAGVAAAAAGG